MKSTFKVSGKKFKLPDLTSAQSATLKLEHRPGGWIIVTDAAGVRHRLMSSQVRGRLGVLVSGRVLSGDIQEEGFGPVGGARASADDFVAQFPGKVRKILVTSGDTVSEGQPLLLLEAMKMEFPIKAPSAGSVTRLLVTEGQQLSPGDRLLDFVPSGVKS